MTPEPEVDSRKKKSALDFIPNKTKGKKRFDDWKSMHSLCQESAGIDTNLISAQEA